MLRIALITPVILSLVSAATAQQTNQPPVKINVLNVCTPSAEDQHEIASALALVPKKVSFSADFEVDRGRSLLDQNSGILQASQGVPTSADSGTADWVRVRREFTGHNPFSRVQYSFSKDPKSMVETLVFVVRDPKDLLQLVIEDSSSAVATPAAMMRSDTPATRVKLERFGKSSVVLARCSGTEDKPGPDQSAYEPLFQSASEISARYRDLLGTRQMVPQELARLTTTTPAAKNVGKKSAPSNP